MTPIDVGGVRLRMLLARLALEPGRPVSVESLIDGLWGTEPLSEVANALQALVSRLRKALRGAGTVDSVAGGYLLSVRPEDVDVHRFEELAARGRGELAAGRHEEAASVLGTALGLWRGVALADVLEAPFARDATARLDELRAAAAEDRFDAELRLGRHAEVLADLEVAGAQRPLSERLATLRMRALSAAGRQSDALTVYEQMRGRLGDELGIDPSAELRETHLALLIGRSAASVSSNLVNSSAARARAALFGRSSSRPRSTRFSLPDMASSTEAYCPVSPIRPRTRTGSHHVIATNRGTTLVRPHQRRQNPDGSGLSGPVRAEYPDHLPGRQIPR